MAKSINITNNEESILIELKSLLKLFYTFFSLVKQKFDMFNLIISIKTKYLILIMVVKSKLLIQALLHKITSKRLKRDPIRVETYQIRKIIIQIVFEVTNLVNSKFYECKTVTVRRLYNDNLGTLSHPFCPTAPILG
jgi:hypothetical protein